MSDGSGSPLAEANIQDVIRERKEERRLKAEEKRQGDLQRIRDMRSTTGMDPLQRFPKEIWIKLFDELDPEDRGNVCEVHPLFYDLLEKTRVRDILLPQVLKVIQTQFPRTLWPDIRQNYFNEHLRQISKSCRKSFDRWMESKVIKDVKEKQAEASSYDTDIVNLRFDDTEERESLKRLLTTFVGEGNCGKRFFPRGLNVSLSEYDMEITEDNPLLMDQFKKDIASFLQTTGDQIWHFKFFLEDLESVTFSFSEVYILFHDWVSLMPNLKWLEVSIQPSSQTIDGNEGTSLLGRHPFPHLTHLERLSFHSSYEREETGTFYNIYGIILEANQHIKMLDLNYGNEWDEDDPHRDSPHIPVHLTQSLELTSFTVCDESWGYRNASSTMAKIEPIINHGWKLQTIVLTLSSDRAKRSLISVLRLLNHFPTLEKVKLNQLEDFVVGWPGTLGYLELPNLTEFEVEMTDPVLDYRCNIHFFFSLQFLLHSKKLKRISWRLNGFDDYKLREHLKKFERRDYGKIIDFRGGLRCLYDSNVWLVFPKLDSVFTEFRRDKDRISESCWHKYLRRDLEGMSISRFWKGHNCSRYNLLQNCVL